jgi:hypothetical protein
VVRIEMGMMAQASCSNERRSMGLSLALRRS